MDLRDVTMWLTLAEERNITKTAARLFISQPALTKRITKTEAEFGVALLIREHAGIRFTAAGQRLVAHCTVLQNDYQNLQADLHDTAQGLRGTLNLGVTEIFAHYQLPQLLKAFQAQYPQVLINVQTARSRDVYALLQNQSVPVAILREGYAWADHRQLLQTESLCLANAAPVQLSDLPNTPQVRYRTDPYFTSQIDRWWHERFTTAAPERIHTSNIDTALAFVQAGLGWAILPTTSLQGFGGYQLPLTWLNGQPFTRSTWLYYSAASQKSPVVARFVDWLAKQPKR
ncbi:LysR family transcriptional regulator [Lacticaseibacillus baoqingensis]|uniref:LysR family transcriptional regulator n=1 Tax=Lacticaseibacillus baoqingensis TaxID=2486013 RepID=A0ABW4E6K4_9LACO|nr:LysR family transcriptional regulator [Lacticaseibacillus baoqingensis]